MAAPFYVPIVDPQVEKYDTTYLETVCRIRFTTTASNSIQSESLEKLTALTAIQTAGLTVFNDVLKKQSIIELYTLTNLMNNFIHMCIDYADKNKRV